MALSTSTVPGGDCSRCCCACWWCVGQDITVTIGSGFPQPGDSLCTGGTINCDSKPATGTDGGVCGNCLPWVGLKQLEGKTITCHPNIAADGGLGYCGLRRWIGYGTPVLILTDGFTNHWICLDHYVIPVVYIVCSTGYLDVIGSYLVCCDEDDRALGICDPFSDPPYNCGGGAYGVDFYLSSRWDGNPVSGNGIFTYGSCMWNIPMSVSCGSGTFTESTTSTSGGFEMLALPAVTNYVNPAPVVVNPTNIGQFKRLNAVTKNVKKGCGCGERKIDPEIAARLQRLQKM